MSQRSYSVASLTGLGFAAALLLGGCSFEPGFLSPVGSNSYECACSCENPVREVTLSVSASPDDAEQVLETGVVNLDGLIIDLGQLDNGQLQQVGLRFLNLGVPRDATIISAHLQFTAFANTTGAASFTIHGEAADDAAPFMAVSNNIGSRTLTTASVPWAPAGWINAGDAGAAQASPDLATVLQEIVDRPMWAPSNALALIISGTGRRAAVSFETNPAQTARLVIQYQEPAVNIALQACVPSALNPNIFGNPVPTQEQLAADCTDRVQPTLSGLNMACMYPSACTCTATLESARFAGNCDDPCDENVVDADCADFNPETGNTTATNATGGTAVCVAQSPMAASLFTHASSCLVEGSASITVDDETETPATEGVVLIHGTPCPSGGCEVGLSYLLDVGNVTFGNFFSSATFTDLGGQGSSVGVGSALVSSTGDAVFAANTLDVSAQGSRDDDTQGFSGTNRNALDLGVVWGGVSPSCSLAGSLLSDVDPEARRCEDAGPSSNAPCTTDEECTDDPACSDEVCNCVPVPRVDMTMALDLEGTLINQPPAAEAGAAQTVECDRVGAAALTLHGVGSDIDGNIASFSWFAGSRTGTPVGFTPETLVVQSLGTTSYVLRVIDTFGQADEDITSVTVEDTTPPLVQCNAPETLRPRDTPTSFTATAADTCDASVGAVVTQVECFKIVNGVLDMTFPCQATFDGATLSLKKSNGVGTHIRWTAQATDDAGNVGSQVCEVLIVN